MMRAVVKGNYRTSLVSAHAAKNFEKLKASSTELDVETIERE